MPKKGTRRFLVTWGRFRGGIEWEEWQVAGGRKTVFAYNAGDAIVKALVPRGVERIEATLIRKRSQK